MWISRTFRYLGIAAFAALEFTVSNHPDDAASNAAAWLELIGLSSWGEGFTSATDELISSISIGAIIFLLALPWFSRVADAVAAKLNPWDGWRVSRLIMKAWSLSRVEALCQGFLAQPRRTHEVRVLVARGLRKHRAEGGTEEGSWEFWANLDDAKNCHGGDFVNRTVTEMDREFPESWLTRRWMKRRQRRERKQRKPQLKAAMSLGLPTATCKVTVVSLPKLWRNPIKWVIWKRTGSTKHL